MCGRSWLAAGALGWLLAGPTGAVGEDFPRTAFADFLANQKEWHGRKVAMHAVFDGARPRFPNPVHGEHVFRASGYDTERHYFFAVTFSGQTKHWLYPAIAKKGEARKCWAQIQALRTGDVITLSGELRLMGDMARYADPDWRKTLGGGLSEVPSVLDVERVVPGWVKTVPEYVADLDGSDAVVRATTAMLLRTGGPAFEALAAVVHDASRTERQRVHAARVLGASRSLGVLPRLAATVRDRAAPPVVRGATLAAMQSLRARDALAELVKLASAKPADAWATDGLVALLGTGQVTAVELRRALGGDRWGRVSQGLAADVRRLAEEAFAAARAHDAARLASASLALEPTDPSLRLLRARAHLATDLVASESAVAEQVQADLEAAAAAGEACGTEWVALGRAMLGLGDAARAEALATRAPAVNADDPAMVAYRVELLVHRATEAWNQGDKAQTATLAAQALAMDANHAAARRLLFLGQDRPMEMLEAVRIGAKGLTVAAPKGFEPYLENMRLDYGQVYFAQQVLARFPGRMPPVDCLDMGYYVREHGARQVTAEFITTHAISTAKQSEEPERGPLQIEGGHDAAYAITTWQAQAGYIVRKIWVFAVYGTKHVHVSIVAEQKLFEAHRTLIFEILRTLRYEPEAK